MSVTMPKIIRFVLNLVIYSVVLISVTYYTYTNIPELFMIKDLMVPFQGSLMLAVILSILLAGINEVMTLIVIRVFRRKKA